MKVCIVGAGKLGSYITASLLGGGNNITVLDKKSSVVSDISNQYDVLAIQMDGLIVQNLKDIEIESYDFLLACTEDDEINIAICSFAKALGCPKVMARIRDPEHVNQIDFIKKTMNIDQVFNPNLACATEIYKYLTEKNSLENGIFTSEGISIMECSIDKIPDLIDKELKDTATVLNGILIGCISRDGKIIVPNGSTVLEKDDKIYLVGTEAQIKELAPSVIDTSKEQKIKRVMIAGGGKTSYFLAKMLHDADIAVKIIETDRNRCEYLAEQLDGVTIINGNATNIGMLVEENLEAMDAFISATGFDEENLLLSLLVKKRGIEDVIAKVSRNTYSPIIENLGTLVVINPVEIVTSNILSFARKSGVVVFSKAISGQAEFKEIQAESAMPITKECLMNLGIPKGILIVAIHRGDKIIIPNGHTQISAGDRVIILTLLSASGELESLLTNSTKTVL